MRSWFKYSVVILILIINQDFYVKAQILNDSVYISMIKSGIDNIYNLRFDEAENIYNEISKSYGEHPVSFLFHGLIVYWKNYPLLPFSPARDIFEKDLRNCIKLSEKESYSHQYEAEALLANVSARGLLLVFYTDNHLSMDVIPLATSTYKYVMRSFDFNKVFADLYYFTGIYNYYREAYPKFHPVYKPVAALFPPGDLLKGLTELNICARNSILLRAEANSILSWIYTYYENNYQASLNYSGSLIDLYPHNLFFKALHIKNLLLVKKYDEAERLLELSPEESMNSYYCIQVKVFRGIIQEKKYGNITLAGDLYKEALYELSPYGNYGNEFSAYACFGLSRICEANDDKAGKRTYHRQALNLTNYKKINFD